MPADRAPLLLRPATEDDAEAIALIWSAGWHDGHAGHVPPELHDHRGLDTFRDRVPPRLATTTVAVVEGEVAGFATLHADELEQLYVATAHRGHGAAGALIAHAEATIGAEHPAAWLAVVAGNARARRFYERSGWEDGGPLAYAAETAAGPFTVPCRRYVKRLAPTGT
ncbi:acetyltransferase [Paraconexibacter sp. AEG42_29]|uniref:Acetyltransferase n=1 Tax=Paraconexibacter sp. AEG42_29 TaxID=2997339 RepID=A0AAU7ATF9_9ACTN